jgi:predicted nucleic acid-binding protein
MRMAVRLPPKRRLCGTAEAADIYGCSQRHIRLMADRREIWSEKLSERVLVVDADEIERLAKDREDLRKAGKLCGRRPGGRRSA